MNIEIHLTCPECDGHGSIETRVSVDSYSTRVCLDCDGEGKESIVETYGSVADAQADYPEAVSFTYL
jgi:DnaJ-class molecular chaperone|tara:strand:- start:360 stop:560 length:201 start_codon:yes stop_codon:yes gene_type:complete